MRTSSANALNCARWLGFAALAWIWLTACSAEKDTFESISGSPAALYGAGPSDASDDAVLLLRATAQGEGLCTATLVAENLVVTTRHCVAFAGPTGFLCTPEGELVPTPNGAGTLGAHFPADALEFYAGEFPGSVAVAKGLRVLSTFSETMCKNDIAFVVLDRTLELPIRPLRIHRTTQPGEFMAFVGYGLDEQEVFDWRIRPRKRLEDQRVIAVGPDSLQEGVASAPPRTLLFEGPSSCWGDSGGPALSKDSGAVTGVFSLLSGTSCSQVGTRVLYTHTAPFRALAEEAFAAAKATPWLEGDPDPRSASREQPSNDGSCAMTHRRLSVPSVAAFVALGVLLALWRRQVY